MKRVWFSRLLIIVWSIAAASACVMKDRTPDLPHPPPITVPPAAPVVINDPTFPQQCADIWQRELGRVIDPAGLAGCLEQFRRGDAGDAIRKIVRTSDEYLKRQQQIKDADAITPLVRLRIEGTRFVDGNGQTFRPVFASTLAILARPPNERAAVLDQVKALGFNGVRIFAGRLSWAGQTAESARAALPEVLRELQARGLYALVTAITDSRDGGYDVPQHCDAIAGILGQFPGTLGEAANEYWHPSQSSQVNDADWLARTCGPSFARRGIPWALGAPSFDEPTPEGTWPIPSGDFITAHLDRGRDPLNMVRRVRELYAILDVTRKPIFNSEPIGAAEIEQPGRRLADPSIFFALGALDRLFGIVGVFHSEDGLHGRVLGPVQIECARAFVAAGAAIPADFHGQYNNVGWATSPIREAQFADAGGVVVRAYSFVSGNSAYVVVLHTSAALPMSALTLADGWRVAASLPGRPHVSIFRVER